MVETQAVIAGVGGETHNNTNSSKRVKLARLSLKHDDFVHDVKFDYYGRRIATCSSDQNIKVWERAADIDYADTSYNMGGESAANASSPELAQQIADEMHVPSQLSNQWVCTFKLQSKHNGAIWRIAWADPEFGHIIASSGMDQHVFIHRERESGQSSLPKNLRPKEVVLTGRTWDFAWKTDINAPIEDIKFAPKSMGLCLGVACADGSVRFYSPASAGNLNDWQVTFQQIKKFTAGCTCIAWNPAFDEKPMLLCGYSESNQTHKNQDNEDVDQQDQSLILYKLAGTQAQQQFLQYGTQGQFKSHIGSIHDIAWAPTAGRSFHMIATSATDRRIIVWKMQVLDMFSEQPDAMFEEPKVEIMYEVGPPHIMMQQAMPQSALIVNSELLAQQQQQQQRQGNGGEGAAERAQYHPNVLRLKWNVTATCFAGSAEDGTVSVWQRGLDPKKAFNKVAGIKAR